MITGLDHVVILVRDIAVAAMAYQTLFARTPAWRNTGDGADRVLFTLENMTLELMASHGDGATADRIRAVIAEQGEGLASLCFRSNDIAKMHRRLDRLSLKPEPVTDAESRDETSGAALSWKRTRAATDATRGVRLFFLELAKERPLSVRTTPASITAMDHVVISTADPERAAALYGARLGLDMALDRSHPDWGRLMFFRCGDLTVEVVHRPGKDTATRDRLWGMSWRVADIDAGAARLGRHRCVGSPNRPQAGDAGAHGTQQHLRHSHPIGGADGAPLTALFRHCEEQRDEADLLCRLWIASWSLSSGGALRRPRWLAMTVIEYGSFSNRLMRVTSGLLPPSSD